jgi:hypothetical protein
MALRLLTAAVNKHGFDRFLFEGHAPADAPGYVRTYLYPIGVRGTPPWGRRRRCAPPQARACPLGDLCSAGTTSQSFRLIGWAS